MGAPRGRRALSLAAACLVLLAGAVAAPTGVGTAAPSSASVEAAASTSASAGATSQVLAASADRSGQSTQRLRKKRVHKKRAHKKHRSVHKKRGHKKKRAKKSLRPQVANTRTTARWSGAVNVNDRSAVNAAYLTGFASGMDVPTEWTGSESRCAAGSQSARSRTATLRALNFTRSLAGLAPVTFSADLNSRAQASALMMSANRSLSHTPPRSWRCYTAAGAANAGRSNLALSYPSITSAGLVSLYLEDAGSSNRAAGHRRWLLNPFATTMGSGSTDTANAVTVIGPTSAARPNPTVVSWPTAGWFPSTLEPSGRWSLSLGNKALSFRWANVRVWRDGTLISTSKNPVVDGYGQPTLVWQVPAHLARSGTFKVQVSSIRTSAKAKAYQSSYVVRMFTPGR